MSIIKSEYIANLELADNKDDEQIKRVMNERPPVIFEQDCKLGDADDMSTWELVR